MRKSCVLVLALVFLLSGTVFALENLALGKSYTVEIGFPDPGVQVHEENYPDPKLVKLTDGKRGPTNFLSPEWVGYLRQDDRRIVIDLGKVGKVETVIVSALQYFGPGIHVPEYIEVKISENGRNWSPVYDVSKDELDFVWESQSIVEFIFDIGKNARYIQITFPTEFWVFLDEIEVLGTWL